MEFVPNFHPCAQTAAFPSGRHPEAVSKQEAQRSWIQFGLEQKNRTKSPSEGIPRNSSQDQHLWFPRGRCPCIAKVLSLLSQDSLQPAPTTEPPSLLPWRNWLDAILRRAGWNSLQIAILSQIRCCPFQLCEQKKCDWYFILFYFILPRFLFGK